MKDFVERMEKELQELNERIFKLENFLENEHIVICPKTNEYQRTMLAVQLEYMKNYARILDERIRYEKPEVMTKFDIEK